jgi:Cobalamin biosynthesis protein CobT (nicotinate-mononucleotide:5, 6-dimethylbenzimidazole phosphoribosyltransferase)
VRKETSALRNRLRSKFLQARAQKTVHGVRNGRDLSDRRLVPSVVELRAGRRPTRPDWRRERKQDVSLAAAVVVDESSSMEGPEIINAIKGSLVIADALDMLDSPCLVVGPRNGGRDYNRRGGVNHHSWEGPKAEDNRTYHRTSGVIIDIFKDWEEKMVKAWPRFGRIQAVGSTPLSDGIQYSLQELQNRPERHRVVLVITDGGPNREDVVRHQIRVGAEAGVHVIGIGISWGARRVKELFPTHVACDRVSDLPQELMKVLEGIMFPKHGKRIKLEGKIRSRKRRA